MIKGDYKKYFKGKKITMLGLGLLGRGLNDAKFFAECGAELLITDLKKAEELEPTLKKLAKYHKPADGRAGIKYVLGEHRLEDFSKCDFVLKASGVPVNSPFIAEAKKNNIPVEMDESLFFKVCRELYGDEVKLVGVTGTRGKTTTTYLIYELLKAQFGDTVFLGLNKSKGFVDRKTTPTVFLGGNIKGLATLPLIKKVKPGDIVVLELSSWQLQGFGEAGLSPQVSVFTNFLSDHLNYYLYDGATEEVAMQRYFDDKAKIFSHQQKGDVLILGDGMKGEIKKRFSGEIKSKIIVPKIAEFKTWKPKMYGEHNLWHIAKAYEVGKIFGMPDTKIKKVLENFGGVEGRIELIRSIRGIEIYNDTTATTPEALEVALKALKARLGTNSHLILIAGGADKKLDNNLAAKHIIRYADFAFLLNGTGTDKIKDEVVKKFKEKTAVCLSLKEAVDKAMAVAKKGDTIILSPGFASFGMFKNEFDRGERFVKLVKKLK